MSRCSALWSLKNVRKDYNDTIRLDSTDIKIPDGYYTFTELQTLLKTHSITINKLQDNHITVTSTKEFFPGRFGVLLGFLSDERLVKDTIHTSPYEANMTNHLREITIYSPSLVDEYRNYTLGSFNEYVPSSLLLRVAIDTTQKLDGTVTNFALDNTRIPLFDFTGQAIEFEVFSGGVKEDYELRMTIIIE